MAYWIQNDNNGDAWRATAGEAWLFAFIALRTCQYSVYRVGGAHVGLLPSEIV